MDQPATARNDLAYAAGALTPARKVGELLDAYRAEVLLEAADAIDAETRQAKADGVLEPDKFRPCRDASAQLRALAGCPTA